MNELTIDENLLNSFPEVVIDGQVRLGPSPVGSTKVNPNGSWSAIWRTD